MVQEHGGVIAKTAKGRFLGRLQRLLPGSDGYYWEVAYGPDWKFDAHGMLRIEDAD